MLTRRIALAVLASVAALAAPCAAQEAYPSRPVRLIVPYPAGSSGDILARMMGQELQKRMKQAFVIDNRPGGGGIAGEKAVAVAAPDGYDLLLTGLNHTTNVGLFASLPFDTERDFTPISFIGSVDLVLVANPTTGFKTAQELIAAAKKDPGKINFGSAGLGTGGHLAMELFARTAGIQMVHVPYKGATPALSDVVAGHVQVLFTGVPPTTGFIADKQLVGLLVGGKNRVHLLPQIPTAQEIGMAGFNVDVWYGLFGPAKMPDQLVNRISGVVQEIVKDPDFAAKLREQGVSPVGSTAEEFGKFIHEDLQRWPKFLAEIGIKPQ